MLTSEYCEGERGREREREGERGGERRGREGVRREKDKEERGRSLYMQS